MQIKSVTSDTEEPTNLRLIGASFNWKVFIQDMSFLTGFDVIIVNGYHFENRRSFGKSEFAAYLV